TRQAGQLLPAGTGRGRFQRQQPARIVEPDRLSPIDCGDARGENRPESGSSVAFSNRLKALA
ncbi:MAG: hypothetical protein Q7T25_15865, partial [Sideroxyarcus sp.]|nr:hypothetical protein [Sideroxyarcus sp.]